MQLDMPTDGSDHQALVVQWIPFTIQLARKHFDQYPNFDLEERISIALEALTYAATKFDPNYGNGFGCYVGKVIWSQLSRAAKRSRCSMSVPPSPTRPVPARSYPGEHETLSDVVARGGHFRETRFEDIDDRELVELLFEGLPDRQRYILQECLGKGRKLREIGEDLGVSKERVRQLREKALHTIRSKHAELILEECRSPLPGSPEA